MYHAPLHQHFCQSIIVLECHTARLYVISDGKHKVFLWADLTAAFSFFCLLYFVNFILHSSNQSTNAIHKTWTEKVLVTETFLAFFSACWLLMTHEQCAVHHHHHYHHIELRAWKNWITIDKLPVGKFMALGECAHVGVHAI